MKALALLIGLLVTAVSAQANVYWPNVKLAGETVFVRVLKDEAVVTALFEFEDWFTRNAKLVYFPIFAPAGVDPIKVLAGAGFELEIRGKKLGIALPCEPPEKFRKNTSGPRVCWFVADIDDLVDEAEVELHPQMIIRVSYTQPLISGRFHYLPVIVGQGEKDGRSWRYQMVVRSGLRIMEVVSKGTDYEQIGETVVVYLKDGEPVVVK